MSLSDYSRKRKFAKTPEPPPPPAAAPVSGNAFVFNDIAPVGCTMTCGWS